MKYILLIISILFGVQSTAISQRGPGGKKGMIGHLKTELGLSDAQADELKSVFESMRDNDETSSREEKKAAMNVAIAEVLTEEQQAKFEALRANRNKSFGKRGEASRKGSKMSKKRTMDEEVQDRLREMRTELDQSISEEDKILIDELRQSLADGKKEAKSKRENYKELSKEEKKELREERKMNHDGMKADIKELKALGEKYESEIAVLFEENKTFFDDKKAEQKEEWKKEKEERKEIKGERKGGKKERRGSDSNMDNDKPDRKFSRRGHAKLKGGHLSKHDRFLLIDPNGNEEGLIEIEREINTISVSPNPASSMTNVSYEVKNAGHVRVEIRDELGRVYEVIANESMESGTYTKAIDITKYQDKTYYISISDGKSIKTEKLLIQK